MNMNGMGWIENKVDNDRIMLLSIIREIIPCPNNNLSAKIHEKCVQPSNVAAN